MKRTDTLGVEMTYMWNNGIEQKNDWEGREDGKVQRVIKRLTFVIFT
jgi:hypothetical protein